MSSQRRINASRANGRQSRGPVTPEGKARSAANSTRHGLAAPEVTARSVVLGTESRALFDQLHQALIEEHNPATASEALLVEELAVCRWRMQRNWTRETSLGDIWMAKLDERLVAWNKAPVVDPDHRDALAFRDLALDGHSLPLLLRYEARLSHQFDRCLQRLHALQSRPLFDDATPAEPNEPSPISEHLPEAA